MWIYINRKCSILIGIWSLLLGLHGSTSIVVHIKLYLKAFILICIFLYFFVKLKLELLQCSYIGF